MRFLGALMVFAACHTGSGEMPSADASPDGTSVGSDGSQSTLGMFVRWHADPALPGEVTDKITITDAMFQLDHLQIVGDAGVDMRTTHSKYLLTWDAQSGPAQETFPDAPVGVYSKIAMVMMSGALAERSYEIHGTWIDGNLPAKRFEIRDTATVSVSIDCDEELPAAGTANLAIKVDLKDALNSINFKLLKDEDGELELEDGPQLMMFRDRLKKAFKLDDDD
jgi:hypothetical protein